MKNFMLFLAMVLLAFNAGAQPLGPRMEPLMGMMMSPGGVRIQVHSHGCTGKNSFRVEREKDRDMVHVVFYRVEEDPCLALLPYGDSFEFSYEELGLSRGEDFYIENPSAILKAR